MAYNTDETSEYGSNPIEVYTFSVGNSRFFYTSYGEDVIFDGRNYVSVPISRNKIESTPDLGKVNLKISIDINVTFLDLFKATSPTDTVSLVITRFHRNSPNLSDSIIPWRGRVTNVRFAETKGEITCEPIYTSIRRPGLRRLYQVGCPHVLYNSPCNVVRNDFRISAETQLIDTITIQSPSFIININPEFNDDWLTGGIVEYFNGDYLERRFITQHNNSNGQIVINLPFTRLQSGNVVSAFPGCNHAVSTCSGKFNNINNYGGFPNIPQKNPMNGTSIF